MKKVRVAINGFGRIGRIAFRMINKNENIEVVAINDLAPVDNLAHLLKYDSVHGRFDGTVKVKEDCIVVNDHPIKVFNCPTLGQIDWGAMNIDI
ncbi:MAG: glyceraldehyde 3-phosphate dehydrogenase NAD-binding domain-containing protein, partial [Bacteroidota bacterium]|nr:glyceraldehyde 3-phosphate dehydrogenase NAD-binding domain-containing protein [Bacteroidota bacterium]